MYYNPIFWQKRGDKLVHAITGKTRQLAPPKRNTYFIGFGKRKQTLEIEAVRNKDFLSCEIYDYYGEREVSKEHLKANRYKILDLLKQQRPEVYGDLRYAIVI